MGHLNHPGNNRSTPQAPPLRLGELRIRSNLLQSRWLSWQHPDSDDGGAGRFPGIDDPAWGRQQAEGRPGRHSPCLGGRPTVCPSLLPAGQRLKNQIAEMCPPPRSFLLLGALRPREQVRRGWQASALLDSFGGGGAAFPVEGLWEHFREKALDGLVCSLEKEKTHHSHFTDGETEARRQSVPRTCPKLTSKSGSSSRTPRGSPRALLPRPASPSAVWPWASYFISKLHLLI